MINESGQLEADWATEYGDLRLSVKIVSGLEEALAHIAKYGTKHSECIVTSDYNHARTFQQRVDAAAVLQTALNSGSALKLA